MIGFTPSILISRDSENNQRTKQDTEGTADLRDNGERNTLRLIEASGHDPLDEIHTAALPVLQLESDTGQLAERGHTERVSLLVVESRE